MKSRKSTQRESETKFSERKTTADEQKEIIRREQERIQAKMKLITKRDN